MVGYKDLFKPVITRKSGYSSFLLIGHTVDDVLNMFEKEENLKEIAGHLAGNAHCNYDGSIYFEISGVSPMLLHRMTSYLRCKGYADTSGNETYTVASLNGVPSNQFKAEWTDGSPEMCSNGTWDAFVTITDPSGAIFLTGAGAVNRETYAYYENMVRNH